jgi:hypothetical protein
MKDNMPNLASYSSGNDGGWLDYVMKERLCRLLELKEDICMRCAKGDSKYYLDFNDKGFTAPVHRRTFTGDGTTKVLAIHSFICDYLSKAHTYMPAMNDGTAWLFTYVVVKGRSDPTKEEVYEFFEKHRAKDDLNGIADGRKATPKQE